MGKHGITRAIAWAIVVLGGVCACLAALLRDYGHAAWLLLLTLIVYRDLVPVPIAVTLTVLHADAMELDVQVRATGEGR